MNNTLSVAIGFDCQLSCKHCMIGSRRPSSVFLDRHVPTIITELGSNRFSSLIVTGGEPALYSANVRGLVGAIRESSLITAPPHIIVLSNGIFSQADDYDIRHLFGNIDTLRISVDTSHESGISIDEVCALADRCKLAGIDLVVATCIVSPQDILLANSCRSRNLEVSTTTVRLVGRADSGKFETTPSLPLATDECICDGLDRVLFIPDKGFTWCAVAPFIVANNPAIKNHFFATSSAEVVKLKLYDLISKTCISDICGGTSPDSLLRVRSSERCRVCVKFMEKSVRQ